MIKKISNNPVITRRVSFSSAWWTGAFTEDQLNELEKYCSALEIEEGGVVGGNNTARKSNISFVAPSDDNLWIFNIFNSVIEELNSRYFNYDLYGYSSFQYTEYDSTYEGKYDWHMDIIMNADMPERLWVESTRKLSIVMPLNRPGVDYTGGEFQLNNASEENCETLAMERGKIYAFPSFMIHRVKPVLTGIRKSIVIWVDGPKFV